MAPGPWVTRDLKEAVLARDYDVAISHAKALQAALTGALGRIDQLELQHRRGHLIYNCTCDDCQALVQNQPSGAKNTDAFQSLERLQKNAQRYRELCERSYTLIANKSSQRTLALEGDKVALVCNGHWTQAEIDAAVDELARQPL